MKEPIDTAELLNALKNARAQNICTARLQRLVIEAAEEITRLRSKASEPATKQR